MSKNGDEHKEAVNEKGAEPETEQQRLEFSINPETNNYVVKAVGGNAVDVIKAVCQGYVIRSIICIVCGGYFFGHALNMYDRENMPITDQRIFAFFSVLCVVVSGVFLAKTLQQWANEEQSSHRDG